MSPNGSHGPNQGYPRFFFQKTNLSPPNLTKQAPVSTQIPPYPETSPKPTKCTSPIGGHVPKQGGPSSNFQLNPNSPSSQTNQASSSTQIPPDPETSPKTVNSTIPNGSHGPKQGGPWKKFQPTLPSPPFLTKQASASTQIPPDPETDPESIK